jgi:hypothetical protein
MSAPSPNPPRSSVASDPEADAARRHSIRHLTRDAHVPCPHCGFDLHDTQLLHCPECGRELDPHELVSGALWPASWDHRLLQGALAVWIVASLLAIPGAALIGPRRSQFGSVAALAALASSVAFIWLTVRVVRHPRGIEELPRPARLLLRALAGLTLLATLAIAGYAALVWSRVFAAV